MIRFRKDTPRYWFMSNYYSCEFVMNGIRYKNAEAAFQSHKVPLEERRQFADMPPASAKRFGRNVAIGDCTVLIFPRLCSKESERNHPAAIWLRLWPCRRRLEHGSGHHQRCSKSLESEC